MAVTFSTAATAYARAAARPLAAATPAAAGGGFESMVQQAAQSTVGALKAGEQATLDAVSGKADLSQVVTAVSNAEVTLQAAVAVRDRVIQAYLDIIRMPI
jgi:flagellar hook-basal body complex protein FliE